MRVSGFGVRGLGFFDMCEGFCLGEVARSFEESVEELLLLNAFKLQGLEGLGSRVYTDHLCPVSPQQNPQEALSPRSVSGEKGVVLVRDRFGDSILRV